MGQSRARGFSRWPRYLGKRRSQRIVARTGQTLPLAARNSVLINCIEAPFEVCSFVDSVCFCVSLQNLQWRICLAHLPTAFCAGAGATSLCTYSRRGRIGEKIPTAGINFNGACDVASEATNCVAMTHGSHLVLRRFREELPRRFNAGCGSKALRDVKTKLAESTEGLSEGFQSFYSVTTMCLL